MKTLILYYSHTGNNLVLAQYLQKELGCDVEEIIERKKRSRLTILLDIIFNRDPAVYPLTAMLENYNLVIFAGPLWNGKIATPIRTVLKEQRNRLAAVAFISLCVGNPGQEEKIFNEIAELTREEPVAVAELRLSNLLAGGGHFPNLLDYKAKESDMVAFAPAIDKFLKQVQAALPDVTILNEYDGVL